MNGILGFASLLATSELTGEEKNDYVELMESSADLLINTVNDYVDISLINSNNLEVNYNPSHWSGYSQNWKINFRNRAKRKG